MKTVSSRPSRKDDGPDAFYLARLERLIRLRRDFEDHLNELGADILDRSLYATYLDCVDAGAAESARSLMEALPGAGRQWQGPRA